MKIEISWRLNDYSIRCDVKHLICILRNQLQLMIVQVPTANIKTRVKKQVLQRHALKTTRVFRFALFTAIT